MGVLTRTRSGRWSRTSASGASDKASSSREKQHCTVLLGTEDEAEEDVANGGGGGGGGEAAAPFASDEDMEAQAEEQAQQH
eukprot:3905268-Rhodomonas_salina.3